MAIGPSCTTSCYALCRCSTSQSVPIDWSEFFWNNQFKKNKFLQCQRSTNTWSCWNETPLHIALDTSLCIGRMCRWGRWKQEIAWQKIALFIFNLYNFRTTVFNCKSLIVKDEIVYSDFLVICLFVRPNCSSFERIWLSKL